MRIAGAPLGRRDRPRNFGWIALVDRLGIRLPFTWATPAYGLRKVKTDESRDRLSLQDVR